MPIIGNIVAVSEAIRTIPMKRNRSKKEVGESSVNWLLVAVFQPKTPLRKPVLTPSIESILLQAIKLQIEASIKLA